MLLIGIYEPNVLLNFTLEPTFSTTSLQIISTYLERSENLAWPQNAMNQVRGPSKKLAAAKEVEVQLDRNYHTPLGDNSILF